MKKILTGVLLVMMMFGFTAAHASSQTVYYTAGAGLNPSVPHPPALGSTVPQIGLGGFSFGPHSTRPTKIHIVDSGVSAGIEVDVCSPECLSSTLTFCTNAAGDITLPATMPANAPMAVFVWAASATGGCDGVATAGTLTASWA